MAFFSRRPKTAAGNTVNTSMRSRLIFLIIMCCGICVIALFVRLFWMQVISYDYYNTKANEFQTQDTIITPSRGTIYDANGNVLAISATTEQITINPQNVINDRNTSNGWDDEEQQEEMARMLSEILGLTYSEVLAKVERTDKMYQSISVGVEKDVADLIRAEIIYGTETNDNGEYYSNRFQYTGISFESDSRRYYPYGSFAAQAIGFLTSDGQGSSGLELEYDTLLSGTAGRMVRATNASGDSMPYEYEEYIPASDGKSIVTTIDANIQNMVEKQLETALSDNPEARGGVSAIVMDVQTGEVLAIANMPDYDPNSPREITSDSLLEELKENVTTAALEAGVSEALLNTMTEEYYIQGGTVNLTDQQLESEALVDVLSEERMTTLQKMWRNNPISDSYEPGSTFKLFTVASAYEECYVCATDYFTCTGSMMIDGWDEPISCWKTEGHGTQTLQECLMNSCNPAMMQIAFRQGATNFYNYFDAFGLTENTDIDLPGEGYSFYWSEYELAVTPSNLATAAFGQRFTVTPIQMLSMVCAIVDDGYLKTPHMVSEILNADGTVYETIEPEIVRQVISEETSDFMCETMLKVVSEGTGQNAYVAGYRIGGKTATSEVLKQTGDIEDRYTASFIGVAPMDDPQVAVLVVVSDLPASAAHGGSAVAAPVVGRLMTELLPYMGVEQVFTDAELALQDFSMPDLAGMTTTQAEDTLTKMGLSYRYLGDGETINDQVPAAGTKIQTDNTVILYLGDRTKSDETFEVPDLIGQTPDNCSYTLMLSNMLLKRSGVPVAQYNYQTVAIKQSPAAGTMVSAGTVITVEFSNAATVGD